MTTESKTNNKSVTCQEVGFENIYISKMDCKNRNALECLIICTFILRRKKTNNKFPVGKPNKMGHLLDYRITAVFIRNKK